MTMNALPSVWYPKSKIWTMPGSAVMAAARASLKNRLTMSGRRENSGCSIFNAARRPSAMCSASQTEPMPPRPICCSTRYAPTAVPSARTSGALQATPSNAERRSAISPVTILHHIGSPAEAHCRIAIPRFAHDCVQPRVGSSSTARIDGHGDGLHIRIRDTPDAREISQRIPFSINGPSPPMLLGVTTPAPVLIDSPESPYFFDSTHCMTGKKPCR